MSYYKQKAEQNLELAFKAKDNELYNSAVQCFYYSLFQRIAYCLYDNNQVEFDTGNAAHKNIQDAFESFLIEKLGTKNVITSPKLHDICNLRNQSSYDREVFFDKERFNKSFYSLYKKYLVYLSNNKLLVPIQGDDRLLREMRQC